MTICLFGAASEKIDQKYKDAVEKLGYDLARRGHDLIFGAGGNGLMGAAARGVKAGGGKVIGVVPKFFREDNIESHYNDCDEFIECDTMNERKQIMEDRCDAFVVVPGGIGTFDEFFEVLTNKQLGQHEKPIAVYNIDGFYDELDFMLYRVMSKGFIQSTCRMLYAIFGDAEDLFSYIEHIRPLGMTVKDYKKG